MAGPWEKYAPQTSSGPWEKYGAAPPAPAAKQEESYLSQVGTGLWNTAKGLVEAGSEAGGVLAEPWKAVEHLKNLKKLVLDPQIDQAIKAADQWKKGHRTEAAGHAMAAVLPGLGPAAANVGEKLGSGDVRGAAADLTVLGATMAAPKIVGAVADVAPRVASGARVVGSGIRAAAPEVAAGAAIAGAGELVGNILPGAEWATRLAGGNLLRSGVAKGLKASREAMGPTGLEPLEQPRGGHFPSRPAEAPLPDAPPESGPPAAAAPEPAPSSPPAAPAARTLAAADIAAQLEASMRAEALTDYVIRNKIPAAMLDEFGPKEWQLVADQAGVKPPTPENIQAIRASLAEHEGAAQITAKTPAEAVAEFDQKRAVRTRRKGPAAATEPAPASIAIDERIPEAWRGAPPPAAGPPAPTASQLRVEALAKHLAADTSIGIDDLATVAENPSALRQLDALGRALGVKGSLAPGEALQIVDRVRQLRTPPQ